MGRGLGALLGTPDRTQASLDVAEKSATPVSNENPGLLLSPADIDPNPFQPRLHFDPVKLAELAESIRTHGMLQPLIVRRRGARYQLVSGERRWRASQQAGLTEVPVILQNLQDKEMLEVALVENVQREDINPLEAAIAYKRLADEFQLTQDEIARRVGKSRPAVANTMRLLQLPNEMQRSIAEGKITEGHGRALVSIGDPFERQKAWKSLLESGGSVRETETAARKARPVPKKEKRQETSAPRKDPHLHDVEGRLRRALGTKVEITQGRGRGGVLTIEFYDDEDLNRILDLLDCG